MNNKKIQEKMGTSRAKKDTKESNVVKRQDVVKGHDCHVLKRYSIVMIILINISVHYKCI